jgi:hypothetical protein
MTCSTISQHAVKAVLRRKIERNRKIELNHDNLYSFDQLSTLMNRIGKSGMPVRHLLVTFV